MHVMFVSSAQICNVIAQDIALRKILTNNFFFRLTGVNLEI